jgi:hypothetical protein
MAVSVASRCERVAVIGCDINPRKRWSPVSTAAHAQAGGDRARQNRLKAARGRRLRLDPDQLVREERIDAATVDVELVREARAEARRAMKSAEVAPQPR